MTGERYHLGTDSSGQLVWKRRNHSNVPPGSTPDGVSPPTGQRRLQVSRLQASQTTTPPGTGGSWPGDPGDNQYLLGWALGPNGNLTIPAAMDNLGWRDGRISIIHDYAGSANPSFSKIDAAINGGFIPSQSFKTTAGAAGAAAIASGSWDATIDSWAQSCISRAPWPIWLCYFHEPEDDFTTASAQADYRAAYRRIVSRFRALGVTNVTWMPIYMNPWTFSSGSGRDWRVWHADWTGTTWHDDLTMDLLGMDTYNPLPGDADQRTGWGFDQMFETMKADVEQPGIPQWDYVIPEFGMSNQATPTPVWTTWATTARNYAKANRIKAFMYWDNSGNLGRYSFGPQPAGAAYGTYDPAWNSQPAGIKEDGWDVIVNAASVWTPPS